MPQLVIVYLMSCAEKELLWAVSDVSSYNGEG